MISIDGRAAPGLDEFMLRLGHLVVLGEVCRSVSRRATRLEREVGAALTKPMSVAEANLPQLADYLATKGFCVNGNAEAPLPRRVFRYPKLRLMQTGDISRLETSDGGTIEVWLQDYYLSEPQVLSRVGAVTVDAKSKSSTGLSHVMDWALILGLLRKTMDPSTELLLLSGTTGHRGSNPYVLSDSSRLILGYSLFRADLDVLVRFAGGLIEHGGPVKKRDGALIYASAVEKLCGDAAKQRHLSDGKKFKLFALLKELRNAVRLKKGAALGSSSTAWHRAASRLESLVDLGFLTKVHDRSDHRYEYVYYPTEQLSRLQESLSNAESGRDWLETRLVDVFLPNAASTSIASDEQLLALLAPVVCDLGRPIQLFPLEALSLGLSCHIAAKGGRISLLEARKALEAFAIRKPAAARLSRGPLGNRAEFISLNLGRTETTHV